MATQTIESRFQRMSVADENESGDGSKYQKTKVWIVPMWAGSVI